MLYLCLNQKQWCTIHLSSFPIISGSNDQLGGGGEELDTGPASNYRSFTLTSDQCPVTTHHRTLLVNQSPGVTVSTPDWRPGDTGRIWHLACKLMENIWIFIVFNCNIFPLVLINNLDLTINFLAPSRTFISCDLATDHTTSVQSQETKCDQIIQTMNQVAKPVKIIQCNHW